jgi:hypothetical protein
VATSPAVRVRAGQASLVDLLNARLDEAQRRRWGLVEALLKRRPQVYMWPLLSQLGLTPDELAMWAGERAAAARGATLDMARPGSPVRVAAWTAMGAGTVGSMGALGVTGVPAVAAKPALVAPAPPLTGVLAKEQPAQAPTREAAPAARKPRKRRAARKPRKPKAKAVVAPTGGGPGVTGAGVVPLALEGPA